MDLTATHTFADGRFCTIARALPEDAAEILAYLKKVGGESDFLSFGAEGLPLTVGMEAEFIASMGRASQLMLKATVDQRIVATLTTLRAEGHRVRHCAEIGLSLRKEFWHLGIGTKLIEKALAWAKTTDLRKINLRVHEQNIRAIRLYERFGFVREGVKTRAIHLGDQYFSEILMGLPLP